MQFTLDQAIKNHWRTANELLKENQFEQANEYLDKCLVVLAKATSNNQNELAGVRVELWKERVWYALENNGLLNDA
jgi:negative regulator of replication initiation